jgi:hypothetical protein
MNTASNEKSIAAFSDFYDRYAPALYGHIIRIVEKEEIAQRVLTKVLIAAFHGEHIDAPKLLSPFTVALNHSGKKSSDILKAISIFQACNESRACVIQST